jgi:hypothetical protein
MNSSSHESNGSFTDVNRQLSRSYLFVIQIGYIYIMPVTSSISFVLNSLCLLVFSYGRKMREKHYLYFKAKTTAEILINCFGALSPLSFCDNCLTNGSLFSQIYIVYGMMALCSILASFLGFMEILIVYNRYIILKPDSKLNLKLNGWTFVLIFLAISVTINTPFLLQLRIESIENTTFFTIVNTELSESKLFHYYWLGSFIFSSLLYCVFLPILGLALIIVLKTFIKANTNAVVTNREFEANKSLTSLVLVMTAIFLASRLAQVSSLSYHVYLYINNMNTELNSYLRFFAFDLIFAVVSGINIFLYSKFNIVFRETFLKLFRKINKFFHFLGELFIFEQSE